MADECTGECRTSDRALDQHKVDDCLPHVHETCPGCQGDGLFHGIGHDRCTTCGGAGTLTYRPIHPYLMLLARARGTLQAYDDLTVEQRAALGNVVVLLAMTTRLLREVCEAVETSQREIHARQIELRALAAENDALRATLALAEIAADPSKVVTGEVLTRRLDEMS